MKTRDNDAGTKIFINVVSSPHIEAQPIRGFAFKSFLLLGVGSNARPCRQRLQTPNQPVTARHGLQGAAHEKLHGAGWGAGLPCAPLHRRCRGGRLMRGPLAIVAKQALAASFS